MWKAGKGGRDGGRENLLTYLALEVDDMLDLLVRESTLGRDELLALLGVGVEEPRGDLTREGGGEVGREGGRVRWWRRKKKEGANADPRR
jgi:hypothetical protein